jgi:hypothetical protein
MAVGAIAARHIVAILGWSNQAPQELDEALVVDDLFKINPLGFPFVFSVVRNLARRQWTYVSHVNRWIKEKPHLRHPAHNNSPSQPLAIPNLRWEVADLGIDGVPLC